MLIAQRTLSIKDGESSQQVEVRLFLPQVVDETDVRCRFEIDWPDGVYRGESCGVDSCQAIILAFELVGLRLYLSGYHETARLVWDEPGMGYGFPVPRNSIDLLQGYDRVFFGDGSQSLQMILERSTQDQADEPSRSPR